MGKEKNSILDRVDLAPLRRINGDCHGERNEARMQNENKLRKKGKIRGENGRGAGILYPMSPAPVARASSGACKLYSVDLPVLTASLLIDTSKEVKDKNHRFPYFDYTRSLF